MTTTSRGGQPTPGLDSPGRILVAGDTHGNLDWIRTLTKLAARHNCAGILQLGDFGFWSTKGPGNRPVLNEGWIDAVTALLTRQNVWMRVIDGNHDAHPLVSDVYPAGPDRVTPIRPRTLDWATRGARWSWSGVRFGALGGAVSTDQAERRPGWSWWATEPVTPDDVEALGTEPLDVLVCHDAPEGVNQPEVDIVTLPTQYLQVESASRTNRLLIEQARRATRPALVLHGHHHHRYRASINGDGVRSMVEGLGCDTDGNGDAWGVLDLPDLKLADGWAVTRAHQSGQPVDRSTVGRPLRGRP